MCERSAEPRQGLCGMDYNVPAAASLELLRISLEAGRYLGSLQRFRGSFIGFK